MEDSGSVSAVGKRRYFVAAMLFFMVMLGYVDRVNMSIAGPRIAEELGLSPGALGVLFSVFFWGYVLMLIPVGWLTDRYGTRVMIPLAIAVWSLGAVATGLMNRFSTMLGARLVLGVGEAPVYPSGSMVAREWAPANERGFFIGMLNAGSLIGPAVGSVVAAYLVTQLGWRASFYILGGLGFVVAAIWALTIKRPERAGWLSPQEREYILESRSVISSPNETSEGNSPNETSEGNSPNATSEGTVPMSLLSLLRQPSMWGLMIAQGCAVYTVYLFLTWLPTYMVEARSVQLLNAGWLTGIIYTAAAVFSIVIARLSDWYVSRERASGSERRTVVILMLLLATALILVPFIQNLAVVLVLFSWTLTMATTAITLNIALTTDLIVDESSGGLALSLLILGGNSFGLVAPIATGFLVGSTNSFTVPFVLAVVLLTTGALITWTLVTRSLQPKERHEPAS